MFKHRNSRRFETLEKRELLTIVPQLVLALDEPTGVDSEVSGENLLLLDNDGTLFLSDTAAESTPAPVSQLNDRSMRGAVTVDGVTYFGLTDIEEGARTLQVWASDGTVDGTREIAKVATRQGFAVANGSIYLEQNTQLLRIDLQSLESTVAFSDPGFRFDNIFAAGDSVYVSGARTASTRPISITSELYAIDGNNDSTLLMSFDGFRDRISEFQAVGDRLFFDVTTGSFDSREYWTTDGTLEGTQKLVDNGGRFRPFDFVELGDRYYFTLDNSDGSRFDSNALWSTDGTTDGTRFIVDLSRELPSVGRFYSPELVAGDAELYFADQRGRLWTSDGTEAGTELLRDTTPDSDRPISNLQVVGDKVWFLQRGIEEQQSLLWQSDGTVESTQPVWQFDRPFFQTHVVDNALVMVSREEIWRYELGTTLSGTAWVDRNGDGMQSDGEQRLAGVTMRAINSENEVIATARTDAGGHYQVVVEPGSVYRIEADVPVETRIVSASEEDVQPDTGSTVNMDVSGSRAGIDVAVQWIDNTGVVRGQAWLDRSANGQPDPGERPLRGAKFDLLNDDGIAIATTTSGDDGRYEFEIASSGSYSIRAVQNENTILGPRGSTALGMNHHRIHGTGASFNATPETTTRAVNIGHYESRLVPPSRYDEFGGEESNRPLLNHLRITELDTRRNRSFIELANLSDNLVLNLKDVRFLEGVGFDFTHADVRQLFPGERLVIVEDLVGFSNDYDTSEILVGGEYLGRLRHDELLVLSAPINQEIHVMQLDVERWFPRTRRADFTIAIANESADPTLGWSDPSNWRLSERPNGSPGRADEAPLPDDVVVISEIMSNPSTGNNDWIELHNTTDAPIDIGGWFLGDDTDGNPAYFRFRIPDGTIIEPQGYVTFNRSPDFGFGLSSFGETLHLTAADENGPLGYGQSIRFSGAAFDMSFGRVLTPDGEAVMVPMETPTFGTENSEPRPSPVVITEVLRNPAFLQDRFVEVQNVSSQLVTVTAFDVTMALPPGQIALIVDIDPVDYRQKYNISDEILVVQSRAVTTASRVELMEEVGNGRRVLIDSVVPGAVATVVGASAERNLSEITYGESATSWRFTDRLGGTPGVVPNSPALLAGDVNEDGRFDSTDLVLVFQAGTYENPEATDVSFAEGDWNGDGLFDSSDLVRAFRGF